MISFYEDSGGFILFSPWTDVKSDRIVNIFRSEIAASVNRDRNFFLQLIAQPLLGRSWRSRHGRRLLNEEPHDDDGDHDANENNGLLFAPTSSHHISSSRSQKKKGGEKKKNFPKSLLLPHFDQRKVLQILSVCSLADL